MLCAQVSAERPPFHGTIFVSSDIITDSDPTSFKRLEYTGSGMRRMFDRRESGWVKLEAHLFQAEFDDGQTVEVQVNPEFTREEAEAQARKYLPVIGQLPRTLREDVKTVWIHRGRKGFGGGNDNLLIHTDQGEQYIASGILAETFFHEAAHTSLDRHHARNQEWIESQKSDAAFISNYALENPQREDVAESFLLYFGLRYKPERLDHELKELIRRTIPARIKYFDSLDYQMHPISVE